jgi:hypothetical protein
LHSTKTQPTLGQVSGGPLLSQIEPNRRRADSARQCADLLRLRDRLAIRRPFARWTEHSLKTLLGGGARPENDFRKNKSPGSFSGPAKVPAR